MTIQNCVRAKYTIWAHEKCGNGCAYKTLWCCCYCTMFGTLNTAIGIPESWGVIFCCCELYPGEDPPEGLKDKFTGKDVKQEVIRQKSKKYKLLLFNDNVNRCAAAQQYFLRDSALRRRLRASCPRLLVQARVCRSGACADHPRADPGRRVHRDAEGAQVGDGGGGRVGL